MDAPTREQIARATVRLTRRGGQGVVVPGGMILTAAHVIERRDIWGLAGEDVHLEHVRDPAGRRFEADLLAVEPIADIAVLGEPPGQELPTESDGYLAALEPITPVPICADDFPLLERFTVYILSHDRGWLEGQARQVDVHGNLVLEVDDGIRGGTSGGPIVTPDGRLLGVCTTAAGVEGAPQRAVGMVRVHIHVPPRYLRLILDPKWEGRRVRKELARRGRPTPP